MSATHRHSNLPAEKVAILYDTIRRIASYQPPENLEKKSLAQYGLDPDEAIYMAYENVLNEAKTALDQMRAVHVDWFDEILQKLVDDRLERIALGFEAWDTNDIWRSQAADYVRGFKAGPLVPAKAVKR
jgi:hypothetical protein